MARAGTAARRRTPGRLALGVVALGLLVLAALGWWKVRSWTPDGTAYPMQGAWIDAADGAVIWPRLKAQGAQFVYLTDGTGGAQRDPAFGANMAAARKAGLKVGAVHLFNPCEPADLQATNFVTTVPRDKALLPPAIRLDIDDKACRAAPGEAALDGELTTFLNQIERHTGRPAILMLTRAFESRYHLAVRIDRNLWLEGGFRAPTYAGRPWMLWTANEHLRSPALAGPLRWVVVRP